MKPTPYNLFALSAGFLVAALIASINSGARSFAELSLLCKVCTVSSAVLFAAGFVYYVILVLRKWSGK